MKTKFKSTNRVSLGEKLRLFKSLSLNLNMANPPQKSFKGRGLRPNEMKSIKMKGSEVKTWWYTIKALRALFTLDLLS